MKYQSQTCGPIEITDLQALSNTQLAALYRELTGSAVTKFRDHATGVARCGPVLASKIAALAPPVKPVEPKLVEGRRRKKFNYPCVQAVRRHREGTKRARLIETLSTEGGALFETCMENTGWPYKTCYENVYLLHVYLGYGLEEGPDVPGSTGGFIRLTSKFSSPA